MLKKDDALKSIKLILEALAKAIVDKKNDIKVYASKEELSEQEQSEDEGDDEQGSSKYRSEDFEEASREEE